MYFYGLILALRARSATYFTATNPSLKYGGAFDMSKNSSFSQVDPYYLPRHILIPVNTSVEVYRDMIDSAGLGYPLIAKPDIGERGKGVEKIDNDDELAEYLQKSIYNTLIQEYIDFDLELGILYYRMPDRSFSEITSIVVRDFLTVTGNGKFTLLELMYDNPRAVFRMDYLREKYRNELSQVVPDGKSILLEPIGNHNRGTKFLDGRQFITPQLVSVIEKIVEPLTGFDYGRFDLKVRSLDDLNAGRNIKILEINGVNSEPAHIYDPQINIFSAWAEIIKHMNIIFRISRQNHKRGIPYASFAEHYIDLWYHIYPQKRKQDPVGSRP